MVLLIYKKKAHHNHSISDKNDSPEKLKRVLYKYKRKSCSWNEQSVCNKWQIGRYHYTAFFK